MCALLPDGRRQECDSAQISHVKAVVNRNNNQLLASHRREQVQNVE